MSHPNIEDEKDALLLQIMLNRIDALRTTLREKRVSQPFLERDILALDSVLLDARIDFQRIDRERSERRKAEADTLTDGVPFKGGHRSLSDIVAAEREAHQSSSKLAAVTKDLKTALADNALAKAKVKR